MREPNPEEAGTPQQSCRFCGKTTWPYCNNSRDMEAAAIEGNDTCFAALEKNGWGEAGERYVRLNRAKNLEHPQHADGAPSEATWRLGHPVPWNSARPLIKALRDIAQCSNDRSASDAAAAALRDLMPDQTGLDVLFERIDLDAVDARATSVTTG